jgi:hypothetical protein
MMCENAQSKKHWLEMFESALYPRQRRGSLLYTDTRRLSASPSSSISDRSPVQQQHEQQLFEEEFYSEDWITNTQENLIILLAERNFDEALSLILRARNHVRQFLAQYSQQQTMHFVDEYVKSVQIKEQELCRLIEKEIQNICERGCSTNLLKHYYHHIQTLKQLGYVPKAW